MRIILSVTFPNEVDFQFQQFSWQRKCRVTMILPCVHFCNTYFNGLVATYDHFVLCFVYQREASSFSAVLNYIAMD